MLNTLWGKFAQMQDVSKTYIIREPSELYTLITCPETSVNFLQFVNDEVIIANWSHLAEAVELLPTVNVVIAAFVTAQARLTLYKYLEKLGSQVIYHDTDSIVAVYREGLQDIECGSFVGDMSDELGQYGEGSFIEEFVSTGPKSYSYKLWRADKQKYTYVCKVKGLTLNRTNAKVVNFEAMKTMVLGNQTEPLTVETVSIRRTFDHDVVTSRVKKKFKITGSKRRRDTDYDTLPYGYIKRRRIE